jgi:tetratricopeptide (TPR) repeat protein
VYYPFPPEGIPAVRVAGEAALLAALSLAVLGVGRRYPYLAVGWFWYLGTLLPVSGVVQLGSYAYADRYTYVPSIGLFIGLVWWLADLVPRAYRVQVLAPAAVLVIVGASLLSWRQVYVWRDSVTLWAQARAVTQDSFIIRTHLGLACQNAGRLPEAESELATASELRPDLALAHDNLGVVYLRQGKPADAEARFREALRLEPGGARYRIHLVDALKSQGKADAAEAEFRLLTDRESGE